MRAYSVELVLLALAHLGAFDAEEALWAKVLGPHVAQQQLHGHEALHLEREYAYEAQVCVGVSVHEYDTGDDSRT